MGVLICAVMGVLICGSAPCGDIMGVLICVADLRPVEISWVS